MRLIQGKDFPVSTAQMEANSPLLATTSKAYSGLEMRTPHQVAGSQKRLVLDTGQG